MTIRITGLNSGLDTEAIVSELMSAYRMKGDKYVKEQTKLSWKQDAWKSLNSKIFDFYKKTRSMTLDSGYNAKKCTVSDPTKAAITANGDAMNGTQTLEVLDVAKSGYLTGAKINDSTSEEGTLRGLGYNGLDTAIKIKCNGKETSIEVNGSTKIKDVIEKINKADAGVQASFDSENHRIYIASTATGEKADFSFEGTDESGKKVLDALGLSESKGAQKIDGQDARIKLNKVEYKSATNTFNINGMSIQALAKTDGEMTIRTEVDVQGIYDKIKDWLTDYNELMEEMTRLYNADSAKGYEPLTSDEKNAMSESDIEAWEDKIKGSLLRRDGTLSSVMSTMSAAMLGSYSINGENYSLSSFKIMTLGYFNSNKYQRNSFHIDGDPDDEDTADKKDVLKAAIQEKPDTVIEFFKQLSSSLYSNIDNKMKRTELSSIYTVYNDKEMAINYSDYTKTISNWEKKMTEIEDSYYKKFSAMETALAKLQSQNSSLTGLFG